MNRLIMITVIVGLFGAIGCRQVDKSERSGAIENPNSHSWVEPFPPLPNVSFDDVPDGADQTHSDEPCYKADEFICQIELAIFRQTNELRAKAILVNREPLRLGQKISYSSRLWSQEMARRGRIGHGGFPRQRISDLTKEFGPGHGVRLSAENVAMTGGRSKEAEDIARRFTQMWWRSPGHRMNILSRSSTIGIGVYRSARGTYYATQMFGSE